MVVALGLDADVLDRLRPALHAHAEPPAVVATGAEEVMERIHAAGAEPIVVGPREADPLKLVQRVRLLAPDAPILLLPPPERFAEVADALRLTHVRGSAIELAPARPDAAERIMAFLVRARLRRRGAAAVAAINAKLGVPGEGRSRAATYLDGLLARLPLGVVFVDAQAHVLGANPAARALLPIGQTNSTFFDAFPKDEEPRLAAAFAAARAGAPTRPVLVQAERALELHVSLLDRADAGVLLVIVQDVTERAASEAELRRARTSLAQQEKLSALGSLVAGVAHEIRTPLAYIANHSVLVERRIASALALRQVEPDVAEELRRAALEIAEGVERINHIVRELRRFTKLPTPPRARVDVRDVVRDAVDLFMTTHRTSVRVETSLEPAGDAIADPLQLQQVALNLLQNAAEASPLGASVRISTRRQGGSAQILVEDEGSGIPDAARPHVFEPLYTTKGAGTGLGLPIVKQIVERHRGSVRFEPREGGGTRFVVHIPLAD